MLELKENKMLAKLIKENGLGLSDFRRMSKNCNRYKLCAECPDEEVCEAVNVGIKASDWCSLDWDKIRRTIAMVNFKGLIDYVNSNAINLFDYVNYDCTLEKTCKDCKFEHLCHIMLKFYCDREIARIVHCNEPVYRLKFHILYNGLSRDEIMEQVKNGRFDMSGINDIDKVINGLL